MPKHVITEVHGGDDGELGAECSYGPFGSHAEANGRMQELFDDAKENPEFEGWDGDDTEASHFYLTNGLGSSVNWFITELEP